jgi:hypothetical protein
VDIIISREVQMSYSGIQRQKPDGSVETFWFTEENLTNNEAQVLQNDDRLKISHEVY